MITPAIQSIIVTLFMELDPVVSSRSWMTWGVEDQVKLADFLAALTKVNTSIRSQFDSAVWEGHATKTVSEKVKPVRAKSSRNADAAPVSTEDKLAKLLNG